MSNFVPLCMRRIIFSMFFELRSERLEPREKKLTGSPETRKFPEVQIFFTASCVRPIDR